jgi:hypothetical protein
MRYCLIFFLLLLTCMSGCRTPGIKYPKGGYDYLKDIKESDSDYYFLPVRKLIPREDSMTYAREKYFFKSFGEPNLSIKAADEDVFRLFVEGFGILPVIIKMTKNELIVKQQKKDNAVSLYPAEKIDQLTETESLHYFFLEKFFPFGKRSYVHGRQLYIDSMIKAYPKLSDAAYYQYLMNKVIDKNAVRFEYDLKQIPLTDSQFTSLVNLINASGFWSLPYTNPSTESVSDGFGFTLEANTKEKYAVVSCNAMPNAADTKKFKQVCQQILDLAQIKPDFKIWSNDQHE